MTGGDGGSYIDNIDRDCCGVYQSRTALILNLDSEGKDWGGLEIKSCRICHRDTAGVVNGKGTAGVAGRDRIDVGVTRIRIGDRDIANRGTIGAVLIQAKRVIIDHRHIVDGIDCDPGGIDRVGECCNATGGVGIDIGICYTAGHIPSAEGEGRTAVKIGIRHEAQLLGERSGQSAIEQ